MDTDNQIIYNLYTESQQREPFLYITDHGIKIWHIGGKTEDDIYNSKIHRIDGPARIWPAGSKEWWVNGKIHRLDGPAVEYSSGERGWYIKGIKYTAEKWAKKST